MIKRIVLFLSTLAVLCAPALPLATSAHAATIAKRSNISGVAHRSPAGGTAQGFHATATVDGPNWNYQAVARCSDGISVFGGWTAFGGGGNESNTANCSDGGHGHMVEGYIRYRQSAPLEIRNVWLAGFGDNVTWHD